MEHASVEKQEQIQPRCNGVAFLKHKYGEQLPGIRAGGHQLWKTVSEYQLSRIEEQIKHQSLDSVATI